MLVVLVIVNVLVVHAFPVNLDSTAYPPCVMVRVRSTVPPALQKNLVTNAKTDFITDTNTMILQVISYIIVHLNVERHVYDAIHLITVQNVLAENMV